VARITLARGGVQTGQNERNIMGELVDRDQEHLRLLKIGYYIMAATTAFFSLFALIWVAMGGLFASGVIPANKNSSDDPRVFGFIFLGIGLAVFILGLVSAFLTYFAGRSLDERRRRIFCLVIAGLCCLQMPWGTVVGIATFIVLDRPSVKALFGTSGTLQPGQGESPAAGRGE
jgi:TctA family transporter